MTSTVYDKLHCDLLEPSNDKCAQIVMLNKKCGTDFTMMWAWSLALWVILLWRTSREPVFWPINGAPHGWSYDRDDGCAVMDHTHRHSGKTPMNCTCCGLLAGLLMLWQAVCMAWLARANCDWSTRPGRPGSLAGSAVPTRYAAYTVNKATRKTYHYHTSIFHENPVSQSPSCSKKRTYTGISGTDFVRAGFFPATQPTVSKDWRKFKTLTTTSGLASSSFFLHLPPDSWKNGHWSLYTILPTPVPQTIQLHTVFVELTLELTTVFVWTNIISPKSLQIWLRKQAEFFCRQDALLVVQPWASRQCKVCGFTSWRQPRNHSPDLNFCQPSTESRWKAITPFMLVLVCQCPVTSSYIVKGKGFQTP